MLHGTWNGREVRRYLLWSFGLAWGMQIAVALLDRRGQVMAGQALMMLMMYVPLLAVLLCGHGLRDGLGTVARAADRSHRL